MGSVEDAIHLYREAQLEMNLLDVLAIEQNKSGIGIFKRNSFRRLP